MSDRLADPADDPDDEFLVELGRLTLLRHALRAVRVSTEHDPRDSNVVGWCAFADSLLLAVDEVVAGAGHGMTSPSTIGVVHAGGSTEAGTSYLAKLADRMERHLETGQLLGHDAADRDGRIA